MATVEERVSYIEGKLDSLATRADLSAEISRLEIKIERLTWTLISAVVAVGGIVIGVLRLLDA